MPINSIKRTVMNADGTQYSVTMQRYVRKYSKSYYEYTQETKRQNIFCESVVGDANAILQSTTLSGALDLVKKSSWFSDDSTLSTSRLIDKIYDQNTAPTVRNFGALFRKMYNPFKKRVVPTPISKSHKTGVYRVSRLSTLGIGSLRVDKRDTSDTNSENLAALKKLKWAARFWKSFSRSMAGRSKMQNHGEAPNVVSTLNAVLSIDTEWQTQPANNKTGVKIRRNSDVLNISYKIWLVDYPKVEIEGAIFNDTGESFNLRQLFCFFVDEIQRKAIIPGKKLMLKHVDWLVTGYFLGVDWSTLDGWNALNAEITTIDKQYIFTSRPFSFNTKSQSDLRAARRYRDAGKDVPTRFRGVDNTITIRDAGLLAPIGGLKVLGEMVGRPKLNTEIDDVKHGHKKGYYKQHMAEYRKDYPKRYMAYVLNDVRIPLEYLKMVVRTYKLKWTPFESLPMTTSNYAMRGVDKLLSGEDEEQRIFRPDLSFGQIKKDPRASVKAGYGDVYLAAQDAFFGGFNVAFGSFYVYGNPVDMDLVSAYVTAGAIMPAINYNADKSQNLADLGTKLVEVPKGTDFKAIYDKIKYLSWFPFIAGVGRASVTYPKDYQGITMTPSRNEEGSPVYVRKVKHQALSLIDMVDAYEHGASIELESLYIPAQDGNKRTSWAKEQDRFLQLREKAKKRRNACKKGSPEWVKYNGEQLLFKLAGNTIYGKSAQSVRPKRKRDFSTNEVENVSISKITDPVIAGTYTAITRYLAHHLYDAVHDFYGDKVLPANITTDGYTAVLPSKVKFDFDGVKAFFDKKLPSYYHTALKRLHRKAGFERKGNSDDFDKPSWIFNLRTRVNGTTDIDCLEALGGIRSHTYTVQEIADAVKMGKVMLPVKGQQLSNLTEMKYGATNHQQGVLYEEPRITKIPLQYDCSYKPNAWIPKQWDGFGFTCVPFETVKDRTSWKKHSKELTDRYNIMKTRDRFKTYLDTMMGYSFYHISVLDAPGYQDKAQQVMKKLNDETVSIDRKYKDAYGRCKRNQKNGKKIGVCPMAIYPNLKLCAGTTSASLSDPHNASSNRSKAKGGSKKKGA